MGIDHIINQNLWMRYKTLHRLLGFQSCFCCLLATSYVMRARYSTSLCIRVVIIISISKTCVCMSVFVFIEWVSICKMSIMLGTYWYYVGTIYSPYCYYHYCHFDSVSSLFFLKFTFSHPPPHVAYSHAQMSIHTQT